MPCAEIAMEPPWSASPAPLHSCPASREAQLPSCPTLAHMHPRKSSEEAVRERQQVVSLAALREPSLLRFYVSREWLNKFNTFAEPGPITNHTFLCSHGGEAPSLGLGAARSRTRG